MQTIQRFMAGAMLVCSATFVVGFPGQVSKKATVLPPRIQKLAASLQGKAPGDIEIAIQAALGKPTRDVGSGDHIYQWDVDGGAVTFSRGAGPSFRVGGKTVWLLKTHNKLEENLSGSFEMTTLPGSNGNRFWVGNLELLKDGTYQFKDSHSNPAARKSLASTFFFSHPRGKYGVRIKAGYGKETLLEGVPDQADVCRVSFVASDGTIATFPIIVASSTRRLQFGSFGKPVFCMDRAWANSWK